MVAKYLYDAWGNCTVSSETTNYAVANANPIRYRGYYYDDEIGLCYCNARYYSPKWRRFISPNDIACLDPESVNGLNIYIFASNNPINAANNHIHAVKQMRISANYTITHTGATNGTYANSSNALGGLYCLSNAFAFFDMHSGFVSGGADAALSYWGPGGVGLKGLGKYSNTLSKFGKGMLVAGSILSWSSSVYNNFTNTAYTASEAFAASALDAVYYGAKGVGTYYAGAAMGSFAVAVGAGIGNAAIAYFGASFLTAFAVGGGVAFVVGIAGAVAIYYLGVGVDLLYEELKEWLFE